MFARVTTYELEEGREDEPPLVHARMRDHEIGLVDSLPAVREDVDVDRPGAPADHPRAPEGSLDAMTCLEELPRI